VILTKNPLASKQYNLTGNNTSYRARSAYDITAERNCHDSNAIHRPIIRELGARTIKCTTTIAYPVVN